jgi:aryl-alcohol dehydrogenase-like predicted oxidoreductase
VMETGVAIHTSSDYGQGGHDVRPFGSGQTLKVLKAAFAEAPKQIPKITVKLYCATVENARQHLEMILHGLGVERIDVAQLCTWADFAEDFRQQGPRWQMFKEFKEKGLIGNYVAEIFAPWSQNALPVIQDELVDGLIFYYNLVDRQASNEVWNLIEAKKTKVFALRTLGGICPDMERIEATGTKEGDDPMAAKLAALKPLYKRSGCLNWVEFSMRFALSIPNVVTTIGATGNLKHVQAFLAAEKAFKPLPEDVMKQVKELHRKWF